ncbi:MAG: hypothetical protein ACOCQR_03145, partial [bacterium]
TKSKTRFGRSFLRQILDKIELLAEDEIIEDLLFRLEDQLGAMVRDALEYDPNAKNDYAAAKRVAKKLRTLKR